MTRNTAAIIFVVSLLTRLCYLAFAYDGDMSLMHPDSQMYIQYVAELRNADIWGTLRTTGFVPIFDERAPGYIYFVWAVQSVFGNSFLPVVIVQAVIDSIVCVLIGLYGGYFHPRLVLPAGLIAALSANMVIHSVAILTDNLFLLPVMGGLIGFAAYLRAPSWKLAALSGAMFAASLMVRPVLYYFLPVLLIAVLLVAFKKRIGVTRTGVHMGIIAAFFVIVLSPILMQNHAKYGYAEYVSQTGTHALFWIYPQADEFANGVSREDSAAKMLARLESYRASLTNPSLPSNPFAQSAEMKTVAARALWDLGPLALAKAWTVGTVINLMTPAIISAPMVRAMERPSFTFTPGANPLEKIINYLSNNAAFTALMFPAAVLTAMLRGLEVLGLAQVWLGRGASSRWPQRLLDPAQTLFLLTVVAYMFAITGPVTGAKYRLVAEPALNVFLAASLIWFWDVWRRWRSRRLA